MKSLEEQMLSWADGVKLEADFWDHSFVTKGDRWPDEFTSRMDPNYRVHPLVQRCAKTIKPSH